jgi:hypothetical protein
MADSSRFFEVGSQCKTEPRAAASVGSDCGFVARRWLSIASLHFDTEGTEGTEDTEKDKLLFSVSSVPSVSSVLILPHPTLNSRPL